MAELLQISDYCGIPVAAELAGVTVAAIRAAIKRGELATSEPHGGKPTLLVVDDVRRWAAADRKPGRRPRKAAVLP